MKYAGNFLANVYQASHSGNVDLQQDLIFSQIAILIENHPDKVVSALNESGVSTPENISQGKLIKRVSTNFFTNSDFQRELAVLIGQYALTTPEAHHAKEYSNVSSYDWIGDIASMIEGVAVTAMEGEYTDERIKEQQALAESQITGQLLIKEAENKHKLPLIIMGGVFVISIMVFYFALKTKKKK
jgi:hypothetical protein